MSNILAIVGRPNVGKSTLFNRLTSSRQAIVEESSGVTRDRHYGRSDWNGVEFSVIDTGGYVVGSDDVFEEEIRKQVILAIEEADVIVFMVDAKFGLTGMDEDVAGVLRRSDKPVFLVANKVDNPDKIGEASEFYALGLGEVYPVSAMNGGGTGDLLDKIANAFDKDVKEEIPDLPRFAVVGRPNVGKSSLVNAFLGNERNIVTPVAGTTRDSIYTRYNNFGFEFMLVDTAGLRKKAKVKENIEFYSVMRSVRAIENSDVCFLMIDAEQGFESQDQNIFQLITRNKKGVVIIVNKWDLVEKETNTHLDFEKMVKGQIAPFTDVPIIFTSVPKKQRIFKALELGMQVYKNKSNQVSTSKLNEILLPIIQKTPPPSARGRYIKVKYITQLKTPFPAFVFFCNMPQYVKDPYKRFLENKIREQFNFSGIPIQIFFRKK
ncbi:MAG TPA: ribosome biogenesis GTPase Der [Bacteroidales bacterium]|nr:ribosome biogenesis GTPase Der [Bacteroidales bacterium]HPE54917.1 ribosome biogenesis GTPase Der [Bacteroidales bacterium]HRX97074.1 ribosome biogenesis GTPase Der [Bacteroidales bacterium]